jgi:hypothetical protein
MPTEISTWHGAVCDCWLSPVLSASDYRSSKSLSANSSSRPHEAHRNAPIGSASGNSFTTDQNERCGAPGTHLPTSLPRWLLSMMNPCTIAPPQRRQVKGPSAALSVSPGVLFSLMTPIIRPRPANRKHVDAIAIPRQPSHLQPHGDVVYRRGRRLIAATQNSRRQAKTHTTPAALPSHICSPTCSSLPSERGRDSRILIIFSHFGKSPRQTPRAACVGGNLGHNSVWPWLLCINSSDSAASERDDS